LSFLKRREDEGVAPTLRAGTKLAPLIAALHFGCGASAAAHTHEA
jgi:hypothetical protein